MAENFSGLALLGAAKTVTKEVGGRDPPANRELQLKITVRTRINLDGAAELRMVQSSRLERVAFLCLQ
jgi:hypothetical protein